MADARHDYRTVLHYAILGGDPAVINLLLKQGATLDLGADYQKPTALDLAILKGDPSIVEMLLHAGKFLKKLIKKFSKLTRVNYNKSSKIWNELRKNVLNFQILYLKFPDFRTDYHEL